MSSKTAKHSLKGRPKKVIGEVSIEAQNVRPVTSEEIFLNTI